jgi:quinol-cytochrome oxidoreductase complex cytochrome b subunit
VGWLLVAAAVELAVLAVTGVFLIFFYQPAAANAWGDHLRPSDPATFVQIVRLAHRLVAGTMILTHLALAGIAMTLAIVRSTRSRPQALLGAAAIGAGVLGLFASFTGNLLPWDQLSLWAVTVGTNMMGFRPILDPAVQVQYVLIGSAAVSVDTVRFWFYVHTAAVPALLLGVGGFAARRRHGRADEPDADAHR